MKVEIDHNIRMALETAEKQTGYTSYVVGGYVRNMLLGISSDDIDFVIEGDSLMFAREFARAAGKKKIVEFPRFKTAKVNYKGTSIEFVAARSEKYYPDSRNPEVELASLKNDLERRDFTINALAARVTGPESGIIIDHFGGIVHINRKLIKTPLAPYETYRDDPLRMLRCIRFAATLGFKIDKCSFEGIISNADRIDIISVERISDEFFKILSSKNPVKGIWLLYRSGLLERIFPELTDLTGLEEREGIGHKEMFIHTLKVLYKISGMTDKIELRLAALMHDIGKSKTKYFKKGQGWTFHGHDEKGAEMFAEISERLKWSNDLTSYVTKIIRLHHRPISLTKDEVTDSGVRRLLFEGGDEVEDLMILCRADITTSNKNKLNRYLDNFDRLKIKIEEVEEKDRLRNFKPPVTGEEIMEFFNIEPGPKVGEIKKIIVEAVLSGEISNEREPAIELLKKIKQNERLPV
ncbi:MAG: HD domain-containing protein [Candidatus Delongbacteria bacterium]|nr:HD domain-containing protein [Candidatus Delongbacteria bacterium]